jgi:hypothetical protein
VGIDVTTEIEIRRPRGQVAAYASDPDNVTAWYANLKAVELRNRGEPAGFSRLAAPIMGPAVKRANQKDLRKLKQILEAGG